MKTLIAWILCGFSLFAQNGAIKPWDTLTDIKNKIAINGIHVYNAVAYGADPLGLKDSTAAIQAAMNAASSTNQGIAFLPEGKYIVASTLYKTNCQLVGVGHGTYYPGTSIIAADGFSGDIIQTFGSNDDASIQDIDIYGRESNLNKYTTANITSVSSRTAFKVSLNVMPYIYSTGSWPYWGPVLFYTADKKFLGYGMVSSVNTSTGDVTLTAGYDRYATVTSSGGNLDTSCLAVFTPYSTNTVPPYSGGGTVQLVDITRIGQVGIRSMALQERLYNVRIAGCTVGLALEGSADVITHDLNCINSHFANIASTYQFKGADHHFGGNTYLGGLYGVYGITGDQPTTYTVYDAQYRQTPYGMWTFPSDSTADELVFDHCVTGFMDTGGGDGCYIGYAFFDHPIHNCIYSRGAASGAYWKTAIQNIEAIPPGSDGRPPTAADTDGGLSAFDFQFSQGQRVFDFGPVSIHSVNHAAATGLFSEIFYIRNFGTTNPPAGENILRFTDTQGASSLFDASGSTYINVTDPNGLVNNAIITGIQSLNYTNVALRVLGGTVSSASQNGFSVTPTIDATNAFNVKSSSGTQVVAIDSSGYFSRFFGPDGVSSEPSYSSGTVGAFINNGQSTSRSRLSVVGATNGYSILNLGDQSSGARGSIQVINATNEMDLIAAGSTAIQLMGNPNNITNVQLTTFLAGAKISTAGNTMSSVRWKSFTLAGGTVTISDSSIKSNDLIIPCYTTPGGTQGAPFVTTITASTSFVIKSTSASDTSSGIALIISQ